MKTIREYATVDKSTWGAGAWQSEPDKVQGIDEATGLDVLLVRGPSGAWCGYVGVPSTHPLYGKGYGQCPLTPPCEETWCDHTPESRLRAHCGITFADACHEPTREMWERWRANVDAARVEAVKYPRGDAAELLRTQGHLVDDYDAWAAHRQASGICHVGALGAAEHVWWFGFDCAHSGDLTPKYHANRSVGWSGDTYRTIEYVADETASLARQLASLRAEVPA